MKRNKVIIFAALLAMLFMVTSMPNATAFDLDPGAGGGVAFAKADVTIKFELFRCCEDTDGSSEDHDGADIWLRIDGQSPGLDDYEKTPVLDDFIYGFEGRATYIGGYEEKLLKHSSWSNQFFAVTYSNVDLSSSKFLKLYVYDEDNDGDSNTKLIECDLTLKAHSGLGEVVWDADDLFAWRKGNPWGYTNYGFESGCLKYEFDSGPKFTTTLGYTYYNGLGIEITFNYHA